MNQTKEFSLTLMAKNKTKKFPLFYGICRFILNPGFRFYPSRRNKLLKEIEKTKDNLVLNIGSGCFKISDATTIINTDISAFEGVNVISDAHHLPFASGKFDAAILENVLEHVKDPFGVVEETARVLKKEGLIFVELPFLYEFHNSPCDFYRFTPPGIENLLGDFEKIESGISAGPTGTFNAVVRNYLAIILSFGNKALYEILNMFFGLILFPLKFLDFFMVKFRHSANISSILYFIGRKKTY